MENPLSNTTPHFTLEYSVSAAKKYIDLFYQLKRPTAEQRCMLAAAHYTIALQDNIPNSHCKMHTNSTIALLQNVKNRTEELNSMIASAYFKRAELYEHEQSFTKAMQDYRRILSVFEHEKDISKLSEDDRLLLAQSAISLADLILNEGIDPEENKPEENKDDLENSTHPKLSDLYAKQTYQNHPLFYVNKSLKYLTDLPKEKDEIWTTLAYTHQIAGIAFSNFDRIEAKEAFRTAISMAFKADPKIACSMLGDIYNCLGLLYEQQYSECPIKKIPLNINDHAMVYFGLALLFQPMEVEDSAFDEPESSLLNTIFETVYRVLDPYLPYLSPTVIRDFIDALIFTYYCASDNLLPNPFFCQQLKEPETFSAFAQHIHWLVSEVFRREHYNARLLDIIQPCEYDLAADLSVSLNSLMNGNNEDKVYYLRNRESDLNSRH